MEVKNPDGGGHIERDIEPELKEAQRQIIMNESRLDLMRDLLASGLCTRDIYSFACAQADICTTTSDIDGTTVVSAMRSKIRDLKQTLKNNHRQRRRLEEELHKSLGGHSWPTRKKIRNIRRSLDSEKNQIRKKYADKIKHYRKKNGKI